MTVVPGGAPMMRPTWSPTVIGISHQPSPQARMPRSFHIRAYSSMRSSATAGIAPSEWLMRYVVSRRIGNRSRYSVSSMRRSLVRNRDDSSNHVLVSDTVPSKSPRCNGTRSGSRFKRFRRRPTGSWPGVGHRDEGVTLFPQLAGADPAGNGGSAWAELALGGADVARRRTEQAARLLLLENVRRPTRDPRAGEHRRREGRRDLGDVENNGGVVLDVRSENTVGRALLKRRERRALELLGHLHVRGPELLRRSLQDA